MVPQLGKARRKRGTKEAESPALPVHVKVVDPAEAGHSIGGVKASDIEWATWRALLSLGWKAEEIQFQVHVFGGRTLKGGQVLDFVLERAGMTPIVIDVRGREFHGKTAALAAKDAAREFQLAASGKHPRLVVVWEEVAHNWGALRALLSAEVGTGG